ncbi:MAG: hypothetical protein OXH28_04145 [bacterium]|nr:hypothetical protein [bacterium]
MRATGLPRSVIVTACPTATPATTAEAFCFRARMPTSDMFYIVVHSSGHGQSAGNGPTISAVNLDALGNTRVALLVQRLGRLSDERMVQVCAALHVAIACD